jgi:3-hydroxyisobutyrate dehydrogenase-like beta-hydroxyacid dehydrogenase
MTMDASSRFGQIDARAIMGGNQVESTAGIIGLGIMGGAIARNLRAAGWRVLGYDPNDAASRAAAADGIEIAPNVATLAQTAPILLTSLASPAALHATAAAIAGAHAPNRIIVEASTMTLDDKTRFAAPLQAAGHVVLDCPISGTGSQARSKDLVIYASGGSAEIARLRPFFAAFSRQLHDLGAYGNGSRMKFVANLLVAIHNVASAEAMVLGIKAGLDPQQIHDLVAAGAGNSRVFELRAPMMVAGIYDDATMKIDVWQKDMAIITGFATSLGAPTPLLNATMPIYASAMATGHAQHDTAAVCAVLERMAGVVREAL